MKHEETSNISIGGNVTGPVAAGHARATAGDIVVNNNLADLRKLADELAELRELMAAGAQTPAQQDSVHEIELAEQQARIGDKEGVLGHLKAAGRWALSFAERLAMTTAETMIKASLGA